jgi:extradiol dioxygenase family protein
MDDGARICNPLRVDVNGKPACAGGLQIRFERLPSQQRAIIFRDANFKSMPTPFHLAIQVRDIAEAREFYGTKLGFPEGRRDESWIDFDMFGHQVVTHLNPDLGPEGRVPSHCNPVDSHAVPVPHFGVVLTIPEWEQLAEKCRSSVDAFIIDP